VGSTSQGSQFEAKAAPDRVGLSIKSELDRRNCWLMSPADSLQRIDLSSGFGKSDDDMMQLGSRLETENITKSVEIQICRMKFQAPNNLKS